MSGARFLLQSRRVRAAGVEMHYRFAPARATGPARPVVLVHGLIVSSRYMVPTAQRLAAEFDVYVPDLPGYGHSGNPPHALSTAELADALADWMSAVGLERCALLGNSFGCQILAELAVRHAARAERLVFVGPTVDAHARTVHQQVGRLLVDMVREPISYHPLVLRDFIDIGPLRALQTFRHCLSHRIEELLPRIAAPVLVVRGTRDPIVPQPWVEQVTSALPDARLMLVEGAAHVVNYNRPQALVEAVRGFLAGEERLPGPLQGRSSCVPNNSLHRASSSRASRGSRGFLYS